MSTIEDIFIYVAKTQQEKHQLIEEIKKRDEHIEMLKQKLKELQPQLKEKHELEDK